MTLGADFLVCGCRATPSERRILAMELRRRLHTLYFAACKGRYVHLLFEDFVTNGVKRLL